MITVNWSKIKPYEKKPFALITMALECAIAILLLVLGFAKGTDCVLLKELSAVIVMALVAHYVHIESRMLQIYMLLGVLDIALLVAVLLPIPSIISIALFVIVFIGLIATACVTSYLKNYITEKTMYSFTEADRSAFYGGKNVMLFAPHEDDEINIYGGVIEQYVKNGSNVKVVFSTNGDVYGLGKMRIAEALRVAKSYGLKEDDFIFLGYSDSMAKDDLHIYNCDGDVKIKSVKGYYETYGTANKPAFANNKAFTRNNVVEDFENVILKYMPDTIMCCDYDSHPDHRAIGLFFEEALGNILKKKADYHPEVFKGFAYSLAWIGKLDYYSINAASTHQPEPSPYMTETNVYNWDDRARFPVAKESLSLVMQNASSYVAMMEYSSQTATDHANGILNCDKVFWHRRTDSVLYNATIQATSGDASRLTEFKLVDSANIKSNDYLPSTNAWVADRNDENRAIMITIPKAKTVSTLAIYDNPNLGNHILNAKVKIGSYQFETGELKKNGSPTIFEFAPVEADTIAIIVDKYEGECSILKVEAFEKAEDMSAQFIKLVNKNDDFCYDYKLCEDGVESFTIYSYPVAPNEYEIETSGDIIAEMNDDGTVTVKCLIGQKGDLTISVKDNPFVYDVVSFSNPTEKQRNEMKKKQELEQKLWTFPMQWDYYRGLVRRLSVYK